MGSGKSSLVLRYVKGQFFDYQVAGGPLATYAGLWGVGVDAPAHQLPCMNPLHACTLVQASTVGAAFLTKTLPDQGIKFEIWCEEACSKGNRGG